ncbi:MAG: hypothetical protein Q9162_002959 [Coniocarpon cinnabarinum]
MTRNDSEMSHNIHNQASTGYDAHTSLSEDMLKVNPQRQAQLLEAATTVSSRINTAKNAAARQRDVRLILVSKLKPPSDILALHNHAPQTHTHFGENYVQELQTKAKQLPKTIKWHFIGGLQSNKCKTLANDTDALWCVSSVDSVKKANELEKGRAARAQKTTSSAPSEGSQSEQAKDHEERLRIHVQINTSGEESKSGVEPHNATGLCKHIIDSCPHLRLAGFMTIGAIARSQATTAETENEDFVKLREVRDRVATDLNWKQDDLELSMGMSNDFESAIQAGADEVRVGSTIFGERAAKGSRVPDDKGQQAKEGVEQGKG